MLKAEALADGAGVSYYQLMENAGCGAARFIMTKSKADSKNVVCLCGCGNNGGDGLVIARELYKAGAKVTVVLPLGQPATACSKQAFSTLQKDIPIVTDTEITDLLNEADIIVDAVFGTGLSRRATPEIEDIFHTVSHVGARVFAIDLPSGVAADTGEIFGQAVFADYTITFAALKYCHILPPASGICGETACIDIGISEDILKSLPQPVKAIDPPFIRPRHKNSHKGTFGTVGVVISSNGMLGAGMLAARAAYRAGCGLVKIFCPSKYTGFFNVSIPEAVAVPYKPDDVLGAFEGFADEADVILIGPGLREDSVGRLLVKQILAGRTPAVFDAGALNLISKNLKSFRKRKCPCVITPHLGEMARLCGEDVNVVARNRIAYTKKFSEKFEVSMVVKSDVSLIALNDRSKGRNLYINTVGNSGLATAGSGDVLAGVIASLIAQGNPLDTALMYGVMIHGKAAENYALDGDARRKMMAGDIIDNLF
jgi:NAD(P)H-hydrate epimerase